MLRLLASPREWSNLGRRVSWKVEALLTTVTEDYDRVSMHGVSSALLEAQAGSLGLGLTQVNIPADCSDEVYDERMLAAMKECRARGISHIAFGDIFLQDVRCYREERLAQVASQGGFP